MRRSAIRSACGYFLMLSIAIVGICTFSKMVGAQPTGNGVVMNDARCQDTGCDLRQQQNRIVPAWNLLDLNASRRVIGRWARMPFNVSLRPLPMNVGDRRIPRRGPLLQVVVTLTGRADSNVTEGFMCVNNFAVPEGNILCRMMGLGFASRIERVPIRQIPNGQGRRIVARVGRCFGNETQIRQCLAYASANGVDCRSQTHTIALQCRRRMADMRIRMQELIASAYLSAVPVRSVQCAVVENCFPADVYRIQRTNPRAFRNMTRILFRFSTIVENIGTADFKPNPDRRQWRWNTCHMHFHSIRQFARYEVIDTQRRVLAAGHKASFCLEDSECNPNATAKYACSSLILYKGDQGISPGCRDAYLRAFDCQWVDVTNLTPGRYKFQIVTNPLFDLFESSFFNNGIECDMDFGGDTATLRNCRMTHPYNLFLVPSRL